MLSIKSVFQLWKMKSLTCNGNITMDECKRSVFSIKDGKSPGLDGFPVEFYKAFWEDIKDPLLKCYEKSIHSGVLTATQQRGVISLI